MPTPHLQRIPSLIHTVVYSYCNGPGGVAPQCCYNLEYRIEGKSTEILTSSWLQGFRVTTPWMRPATLGVGPLETRRTAGAVTTKLRESFVGTPFEIYTISY